MTTISISHEKINKLTDGHNEGLSFHSPYAIATWDL